MSDEVKIMLELSVSFGEPEREQLQQVGMSIDWGGGNKVIGRIAAENLDKLQALSIVREVETSVRLKAHRS